jgi:AraC-like DNA-binding protein
MPVSTSTRQRGILRPDAAPFRLAIHAPPPDLAGFVERHWVVRWDLRGREPYLSEILPHPSVHLVIEPGGSAVHGVATGRWSRLLEGRGEGVGTKFWPGGFAPFSRVPVVELTNTSAPLEHVLGPGAGKLERDVLACGDDGDRIAVVQAFLRGRLPAPDPRVATVARIVRAMLEVPPGTRLEEISRRFGMSPRTMQRLFRSYVGVNPKWVLQRYRLHEAAERIAAGERDLARLAPDLGYFDQAHFIKDFKALVGRSPAEYAAECARAAQLAA